MPTLKQTENLLGYLKEHPEGITQSQALYELGIARLASRINDLRKAGIIIHRDMVPVKTRYGQTSVARYRLTDNAEKD